VNLMVGAPPRALLLYGFLASQTAIGPSMAS
jgi:hypothetical protein